MREIWRDIKDYEGLYQVSNFGRVKSLNYHRSGEDRVMKPVKEKNGYFRVGLRKDGKQKRFSVHRLVATAFLPNPENKPEVNHIDEDKTNNSVWNIEWVWHIDNCNHGTHNERVSKSKINGITSKKVLQFTLDGKFVKEWPSTMECGRNGFQQGAVAACCRGNTRLKTYKGFRWKYAEG